MVFSGEGLIGPGACLSDASRILSRLLDQPVAGLELLEEVTAHADLVLVAIVVVSDRHAPVQVRTVQQGAGLLHHHRGPGSLVAHELLQLAVGDISEWSCWVARRIDRPSTANQITLTA